MTHRGQRSTLPTIAGKGCNSGIARWKKSIGQGMGDEFEEFHALSKHATLLAPWCVYQPGSSPNPTV